jgi:hypothetical protein
LPTLIITSGFTRWLDAFRNHIQSFEVPAFYFARAELRRAGDVSPLILRVADNQGINIPRSPKADLNFDRSQYDWHVDKPAISADRLAQTWRSMCRALESAMVDFIEEIDCADCIAIADALTQKIHIAITADRTTGGGN